VIRIAPDGALDDTFGSGGYKLLDVEATDNVAHAVALGPNGTLILAGEILDRDRGTSDFALVRLNADGQADTGFRGGVVVTDFLYGADNRAFAVDVQADGKIIAAGFTTYPQDGITGREGAHFDEPTELLGTEFFALARYNADGTLDQSFGSGGLVTTVMAPGPAGSARARAVQIQTDGRIVAAGTASGGAGTTSSRVALARYLTDGTLDESFGGTGRVLLDIDGTDEGAYAMAIDPRDGTIVVAGATARDVESQQHFLIARLDCDGRLDPTFNRTGGVTNRAFAGVARAVLLLPDGRVIAAGSAAAGERAENGEFVTREQVALACYTQDGSSDESFGMGGILLLDLGGDIDGASGLALDGNSILVVGSSRTGARSSFAVLRLNMAQM
jgi:uncharacterized delta-60 repeat protein